MTTYSFDTTCTMKPYNRDKYWIMNNYVDTIRVKAESVRKALAEYRNKLEDMYGIKISDNAMQTKSPMWYDTKDGKTVQTGYVITGKTGFENRSDNLPYTEQFIELWVTIEKVDSVFN